MIYAPERQKKNPNPTKVWWLICQEILSTVNLSDRERKIVQSFEEDRGADSNVIWVILLPS